VVFTNEEDCAVVAQKYEEFFTIAVGTKRLLHFVHESKTGSWGDEEMHELSRSLPMFTRVEQLIFANHNFSDDGLHAVLKQVSKLPLGEIGFGGCTEISGTGFEALAGCQLSTLATLNLSGTGLNDYGLMALGRHLSCFPGLKQLQFSMCVKIGTLGIRAIAKNLPVRLEELYFGHSSLNDEGVQDLWKDCLPSNSCKG